MKKALLVKDVEEGQGAAGFRKSYLVDDVIENVAVIEMQREDFRRVWSSQGSVAKADTHK